MLLAYFDDSGARGHYLLAAVVVPDDEWLDLLDAWTDYRRWLRKNFGIRISKGTGRRVPVELHATDFATGAGAWYKLPVNAEARLRAFRIGLQLIGRFAQVFAVAWVPSRKITDTYMPFHVSPAIDCWRTALERLATYGGHESERVLTFIDSGYGLQFTRALRKMRRYHRVGSLFGGTLPAAAPMLVDDPIVKDSKESPFIQMADLCAYAAFRELLPKGDWGLWGALGDGILRAVNKYTKNQPPGIKLLPP
jgi:hypothetical protein